ncbi:peptidoglycan recognition family protein [Mycobacterium sp. NPDC051804]|uniref:peptidoglycan recognition family protein n=1 Tax=Mycobacterium sp. NPDC051804 TaxID=3364295 RepID=UPI0037B1D9EF
MDRISRRKMLWLSGAGLAAAAAPIAVSAVTSAAPVAHQILCRDAWGAAAARPGGRTHTLNRMTVHHTEVTLGDNANAPARLRQHQRYHQDTHGWIDIAYHFSVDRNGNIYQLRRPDLVGDTATSYDPTGHFLVVCEGDFDKEQVTEQQLDGTALVLASAAQQFGIPTDTLAGHRDFSPSTICPGTSLYDHITSGDLQNRVDSLLAAGPVDLPTICGPGATETVADIEAGLR